MAFPPICCALADKEKEGGGKRRAKQREEKKIGFLTQTVPKAAPWPCKARTHPSRQRAAKKAVDDFASSAVWGLDATQDIPRHAVRDADIDGERC